MRIDPAEVTDAERAALVAASPPITAPAVQAFLAWRRSLLLMASVFILPVVAFHIVNLTDRKDQPEALTALYGIQLAVDVIFAILLWTQLPRWTNWRRQRLVLARGWLLYFLMPFIVYLYPLRSALDDAIQAQVQGQTLDAAQQAAMQASSLLFGLVASLAAMIELAPRAISLMPGLVRGAITSKLLFPGSSGPGWLIVLLAPIYAVLLYVVLMIPYQLTAGGFFLAAMVGLITAQLWLGRAGYKLARPERLDEALILVRRVRTGYLLLNLGGLVCIAVGMIDLMKMFELPVWGIFKMFLALLVNILLLTLVATDTIVANLAHGQELLATPGAGDAYTTFSRDALAFGASDTAAPRPGQERPTS